MPYGDVAIMVGGMQNACRSGAINIVRGTVLIACQNLFSLETYRGKMKEKKRKEEERRRRERKKKDEDFNLPVLIVL